MAGFFPLPAAPEASPGVSLSVSDKHVTIRAPKKKKSSKDLRDRETERHPGRFELSWDKERKAERKRAGSEELKRDPGDKGEERDGKREGGLKIGERAEGLN